MPNNELGKRIPLEGTINTRDLGGYITKDGRKVKYRRLIR
ncbi:MAG: tyrosine-protein phosphatase, partial [Bacilli bacterium]|nr:tyrosine-protein phosphatase [Bacilli bacterium]